MAIATLCGSLSMKPALVWKQGPLRRRQPKRRVFNSVAGNLLSNDATSLQQTLAKERLRAGFSAWQAVVEAEKHATLAAAELLADEQKAARSKKKSQKSRARKLKKFQVGDVDESQQCFDGKTLEAPDDEHSGLGGCAGFDDCIMDPDRQHVQPPQATRHSDFGWHEPLDFSSDPNPEQGCFLERDVQHAQLGRIAQVYGVQTEGRAVVNMPCQHAPLPSLPSCLVVWDIQVRNTFLHIPLPESSEHPVQRRALSAPPRLAPSTFRSDRF